jgi:hypothetical protein
MRTNSPPVLGSQNVCSPARPSARVARFVGSALPDCGATVSMRDLILVDARHPAITRDGERAETGERFIWYWCQCHESLHLRFV